MDTIKEQIEHCQALRNAEMAIFYFQNYAGLGLDHWRIAMGNRGSSGTGDGSDPFLGGVKWRD